MGEMLDILAQSHKNNIMKDTWGHIYPKPGCKYYGEMTVVVGEYGDQIILTSNFPHLPDSPQRHAIEHSIFDRLKLDVGIHKIKCGMWFYKTADDAWLNKPIGRLINIQKIK